MTLPTNAEYIVDTGQMGLEAAREDEQGPRPLSTSNRKPTNGLFTSASIFPDQVYGNIGAKEPDILNEIKAVHPFTGPADFGRHDVGRAFRDDPQSIWSANRSNAVLNAKIHQSEALIVAQAGAGTR